MGIEKEQMELLTRVNSEIVIDSNGGASVLLGRQKTDRGWNGVVQSQIDEMSLRAKPFHQNFLRRKIGLGK